MTEAEASPARIREVLDLAIRIAEVLFASGAGAEDVTTTMAIVARRYGVRGAEPDVTHTLLTMTWTNPKTHATISRRRIMRHRGLDYARLSAAASLIAELGETDIPLETARDRVADIVGRPPLTPVLVRRIGWAVIGTGAALLLGGGWLVAAVAFVAAFVLDALTVALGARNVPVFFQCCLGGVIGPLAAALVHVLAPDASASLVVVATIVMMLAGVTTFGAVQDTIAGFYVTGVARLTEAVVVTMGIAAGVIGMSLLLARLGMPLDIGPNVASSPYPAWVSVVAAMVIVVGFALAVQLPWRAYWVVCLSGAIVEGVSLLCMAAAFGTVAAAAVAAVAIGVLASATSRLSRTPSLAIVVTSLVPLVPGLILYNGLMRLSDAAVAGLFDVFTAAAVAGALAAGALFGQYLVQFTWRRATRVRRRAIGPLLAIPARFGRGRDTAVSD